MKASLVGCGVGLGIGGLGSGRSGGVCERSLGSLEIRFVVMACSHAQRSATNQRPNICFRGSYTPPNFFFGFRGSSFVIFGNTRVYSIYSFVFHLGISHLALICLSTYLCVIGG